MKQCLLLVGMLGSGIWLHAQDSVRVKTLITEGISLHDQRQYAAAIRKYDTVLRIDPVNLVAQYEKSYSLMASKNYKEAMVLSRAIAENKNAEPGMTGNAYSTWGSALDESGDHQQALKIYDEGIKKVPGYYMLNYNKAVTYFRMNEMEKGIAELKLSLLKNPRHPASHFMLGRIMHYRKNKVAAMMPLLTYLLYDNKSKRAEEALTLLRSIVEGNIRTLDSGKYAVDIAPEVLAGAGKKKATADDDFGSMELLLELGAAAASANAAVKEMLPADRFAYLLKQAFNSLTEQEGHDGFYGSFYLPFFTGMHKKGLTESFAHLVFLPSGNVMNEVWIQDHRGQMEALRTWAQAYQWPVAETVKR
ncbi:tetratricopeptide repeat protein [Niabella pedocola]|uniref:Tetratricopeptide repeat protein n=1 Tax=Niabella pedocola TaxID=1752077 RepID=A0ABS8PNR6_9BACT|nr:tetratricopeptide repeat protein [Niabella pedocola]MCD2421446.1 tetratricopeptide repeat protein [Niabella pedocola]